MNKSHKHKKNLKAQLNMAKRSQKKKRNETKEGTKDNSNIDQHMIPKNKNLSLI
jgi:hypothetical protein